MEVSEARLRRDIESNAEFGAVQVEAGNARTVLSGTAADRAAREYFVERCRDAGMAVSVDAVGNVVGRWVPEGADPDADAVAAGSHLDSVPEGGIFDGPLGVYAALEAVRAMQAADLDLARPIEVVNLTEEEGQRFGGGLVGSAVAAGDMTVEEAHDLSDDGQTLHEALDDIGFLGEGTVDASEWDSWLELHIEQGTRLEDAGMAAGIVTSITGLSRCAIEVSGEANHAGTTPMGTRTDALAAASEFVLDVEDAANEVVAVDSSSAVGTVGKVGVGPNAPNVIPGRVDLSLDVRDVDPDAIETIVDRARASLARIEDERDVEASFERPWHRDPVPMSDRVRDAFCAASEDAGVAVTAMHSGAAHDTMNIAQVTDAGLLFAPSRDGISHNPAEWTDWEDCAAATRVLAGAIAELASD
ncbi:Zn-dependent hydrolase [Haloarchaeobius amylolyticus]|uniref:Zn-dependent hydrolase n=1 Tax=Haloarchaeobius amylolyticus TaxID=1198296 RepID=UPI00226E301C|nr:Zn-dependent hydrolase [Haloarchaeobius amylolyticus]